MADLNPRVVDELLAKCLCARTPDAEPGVVVEGIVNSYRLDPERIVEHSGEIEGLLRELPVQFRAESGGGWSFLKACDDRHGRQWAGMHQHMERLFCLGIAAGMAQWSLSREYWPALPGGVPYVTILVSDREHGRA